MTRPAEVSGWTWDNYVVFLVPFAVVALGGLVLFLLRHTLRTRARVAKQLREDPDINEWLVAFDWSRKVLYLPVIAASIVGAAVMLMVEAGIFPEQPTGKVVGGVWVALFVLSFLVEEYDMSLRVLVILVLAAVVFGLWLHQLGWLGRFFSVLGKISVSMSWMGFLFIAVLFSIGIFVSWVKGLFYYIAVTPNYMNIQTGVTETGEQIAREDYSTRIDSSDLLERIMGFGRIVVTFRDNRRLPMTLLVWGIGRKASTLESIQGKLAVDRHQPGREGTGLGGEL